MGLVEKAFVYFPCFISPLRTHRALKLRVLSSPNNPHSLPPPYFLIADEGWRKDRNLFLPLLSTLEPHDQNIGRKKSKTKRKAKSKSHTQSTPKTKTSKNFARLFKPIMKKTKEQEKKIRSRKKQRKECNHSKS